MRKRLFFYFLICFAIFLVVTPRSVVADGETPVTDDQINAVAHQLYCPVCENTPLDVCPTTACAQWRALIGEKLSQGWSSDQIKDYFVTQYGDRVLAEPPRHGINWLVYILPPLVILIAAGFLFAAIRRMRLPVTKITTPVVQSPENDSLYAEIEAELKLRKDHND